MQTKQKRPYHYYSSEEIRFLKRTIKGRSYSETRKLFNEHFGLELTFSQIACAVKSQKLHNGIDGRFGGGVNIPANKKGMIQPPQLRGHGFKPGHALNSAPIGTKAINEHGYVKVKIDNRLCNGKQNWKLKHIIVWEKAYGKIPDGHVIIFADGNKSNFDLDNLLLVSWREFSMMIRNRLIFPDKKLTKSGKLIADLKIQSASVLEAKK